MWEILFVLLFIILLCICVQRDLCVEHLQQCKDRTKDKSDNDNVANEHIDNEQWVTYDSSDKLVEEIYEDQVEGEETTFEQQDAFKKIWNSGEWHGHYSRNERSVKIPPFTLNFVFESDTVVGYGEEEMGEFLISGYFNPYNNRYTY